MIIDFLEKNDNFGVNLHISDERGMLLDTGGGILKARQWLDGDEPFLVHNTDIISTLDLKAFYDYHVAHEALATILVKERKTQRYFLFDEDDRLCGWTNKATGEFKPDPEKLRERYPEFREYEGKCRFRECLHDKEPGCAVQAAAEQGKIHPERLRRYRLLLQEIREEWRERYG